MILNNFNHLNFSTDYFLENLKNWKNSKTLSDSKSLQLFMFRPKFQHRIFKHINEILIKNNLELYRMDTNIKLYKFR